jgi:adenine-specific DNA-methyltransferase
MSHIELHNVECLAFMRTMSENSVDAIVTDPPYFGVKEEDWDNQWRDADHFIEWIGELSEQWQRILRPNGSLYCFASPRMAARVEVKIGERFDVLNHVIWRKHNGSGTGTHNGACKEVLRGFFPEGERIIFAEQYGTDENASSDAGYEKACQRLCRDVFQIGPLVELHGVTRAQIASLILADYKNEESAKAQASNWILGKNIPNEVDFQRLKTILPIVGRYQDLRTQYEELRTQYEELRRPFNVTPDVPYTDVWTFRTVQAYEGKHVCEKPLALMEHIILASTRPDAIVFDPFMGSGSTGVAAVLNGRSFIGCEKDPKHFANASARIRKHRSQPRLFEPEAKPTGEQLTIDPAA